MIAKVCMYLCVNNPLWLFDWFFFFSPARTKIITWFYVCYFIYRLFIPQETAWSWRWWKVHAKLTLCMHYDAPVTFQTDTWEKKKKRQVCVDLLNRLSSLCAKMSLCDSRVHHDILQLSLGLLIIYWEMQSLFITASSCRRYRFASCLPFVKKNNKNKNKKLRIKSFVRFIPLNIA